MSDAKPQRVPPGPDPDPELGNFPQLDEFGKKKKTHKLYEFIASEYGPVARIDLVAVDAMLLSGEQALFEAFCEKDLVLIDRPTNLANVNDITEKGKGIILQNGQAWRELKTTALVALTSSKNGSSFQEGIILGETHDLIKGIKEEPEFQPRDLIQDAVFNIQSGVVFGERYSHADRNFQKLSDALRRVYVYDGGSLFFAAFPDLRFDPAKNEPYLKYKEAYFDLYDAIGTGIETADQKFTESVFSIFKAELEKEDSDSRIYSRGNIIRSMADMFIPCGIVAALIDWAVLYMVEYPAVQRKCQQELDNICESDVVTTKDLKKLSYIQATLLEVKRISGTFPTTFPHTAGKDMTLQGFHIPKGTLVLGFLNSLNTDGEVWNKPDEFRPERFLEESGISCEKRRRLRIFGLGVRKCPGEVETDIIASLVFSNLIKAFTFSKIDGDTYNFDGEMDIAVRPAAYRVKGTKR